MKILDPETLEEVGWGSKNQPATEYKRRFDEFAHEFPALTKLAWDSSFEKCMPKHMRLEIQDRFQKLMLDFWVRDSKCFFLFEGEGIADWRAGQCYIKSKGRCRNSVFIAPDKYLTCCPGPEMNSRWSLETENPDGQISGTRCILLTNHFRHLQRRAFWDARRQSNRMARMFHWMGLDVLSTNKTNVDYSDDYETTHDIEVVRKLLPEELLIVFDGLCLGRTGEEIAKLKGSSRRTVTNHKKKIIEFASAKLK